VKEFSEIEIDSINTLASSLAFKTYKSTDITKGDCFFTWVGDIPFYIYGRSY
jgi:hypothetical protein